MSREIQHIIDKTHASTAAEVYFRVAMWFDSLKAAPSIDRVMEHFGVSRATAYRWRSAWRNAKGIE